MNDKKKFPTVYKSKVEKLKNKIQNEYYYHDDNNDRNLKIFDFKDKKVDKMLILKKINDIFSSPNYVYQADISILYKNGENISKKVIGFKDNYLITLDGEKIFIDDIYDIK